MGKQQEGHHLGLLGCAPLRGRSHQESDAWPWSSGGCWQLPGGRGYLNTQPDLEHSVF
jgi:hypothetical protein